MWIYYPLIIVIVGVILLFKWIDSAWSGRGDKGEKSDNRELKRYAIVFLFFILIGAVTIPTMGNYWPLAEVVLVFFIPFFRWRDLVDSGRTEELKQFYRNAVKTIIVCATALLIGYLAFRFGNSYYFLLEGLLVLYIPIFGFVDGWQGGGFSVVNVQKKFVGALIVVAIALGVFLINFFSPLERYKRAIGQGNLGTAAKIYAELSEEDQKKAEDYTKEVVGNVLGNLF